LNEVKSFNLKISGTICVEFFNGKSTYVSRRYVSKIKERLGV
jgi:DNA-binding LytR/AlgR family response regulator